LSEEQVCEIRLRSANDEHGTDLAKEFGVTQSLVSRIVNRRIWKHI